MIDDYNARVEAFNCGTREWVDAGMVREETVQRGGRTIRRRPQLTVFQFDGLDDLVLTLAHERGHAIGTDHIASPGAIIHGGYLAGQDREPHLTSADLAAFRQQCAGGGNGHDLGRFRAVSSAVKKWTDAAMEPLGPTASATIRAPVS